ncbi:SLC13 family permease [Acidocella sp. KAb 2-4]|uniref:SLC13 family permease n=1 Tax=Acidocella sp. KAb 2-4 TaxID=2885158 RepID=UPI001D0680C8|nr:SLC13 family permease [Acidocella sp. KAb 2-4]MCB5945872.1 anion permease [Acidocella sp. KAb 2-4]
MSGALTWGIVLASLAGILLRPWGLREWASALAGAALLVLAGALPPAAAWRAVGQGADVYLFLIGMMLLAELAAAQGVFAWAAGLVARAARGSAARLFVLIYAMAVLITVFLSNDATAVVFTPAVASMAAAVGAERRLPFLLICAFVANAASFVLPISNPANLVVFTAAMPDLPRWLALFGPASAAAVGVTFLALWLTQRDALRQPLRVPEAVPPLSPAGRLTLAGLGAMAALLLAASALGWRLGLPTFCAGLGTAALVGGLARVPVWGLWRQISWGVLPLVAGLFVMVGALDRTGLAPVLGAWLRAAPWAAGPGLAGLSNLVNNLPSGLLAGQALAAAPSGPKLAGAVLIGVDLGPNLSITGSLATLLWLTALRRHGLSVSAWRFLRLGAVVMPPALATALALLWLAS